MSCFVTVRWAHSKQLAIPEHIKGILLPSHSATFTFCYLHILLPSHSKVQCCYRQSLQRADLLTACMTSCWLLLQLANNIWLLLPPVLLLWVRWEPGALLCELLEPRLLVDADSDTSPLPFCNTYQDSNRFNIYHSILKYTYKYDIYIYIYVNCNWVDTRWQ